MSCLRRFRQRASLLLLGLLCFSSPLFAHLGEIHPEGKHDYFPDFPISPLGDDIYFQNVLSLVGARDMQQIPDGSGRFLVMRGTNHVKLTAPGRINEKLYVTIGEPNTDGTEGSTSIALHPGFATPGDPGYGKFYTASIDLSLDEAVDFETNNPDRLSHYVLTEWTQEDISAERFSGTSRELMRISKGSVFHSMNHLLFGPDGMLYMGVGQDAHEPQAADIGSIYGKVLRIDPMGTNSANGQYGIPDDNPFVDNPGAAHEVYAYGLKNPWRLAFDRETGDLYAGDVGWHSIEEVDLIKPGLNYGWPLKEGRFIKAEEVFPDEPDPVTGLTLAETHNLVEPLFELDHTDTNSIIGGVLYRGERIPELQGKFIFGAWDKHDVYVGDPETGEAQILIEGERIGAFMGNKSFVSINEDLDGEIYLLGGLEIVSLFQKPDFDDSGSYDLHDFQAICAAFGSEGAVYDLNGDLQVDADDIEVFKEFSKQQSATAALQSARRRRGTNNAGRRRRQPLTGLPQPALAHWTDTTVCEPNDEMGEVFQAATPAPASGVAVSAIPEPNSALPSLAGLLFLLVKSRRARNRGTA